MSDAQLQRLYGRPGFMIRRAHQIASSVFLEETQALRITPTQYGVLYLLKNAGRTDQVTIANLLGFDRSTTSLVVRKLERRGLVERRTDRSDRRRRYLQLTSAGENILRALAKPVQKSLSRLLSIFDRKERDAFLSALGKFVDAFTSSTRVPIPPAGRDKRQPRRSR